MEAILIIGTMASVLLLTLFLMAVLYGIKDIIRKVFHLKFLCKHYYTIKRTSTCDDRIEYLLECTKCGKQTKIIMQKEKF